MPNFNRRGLLQLLGTASLAPLLPALPSRALATTASASTSKALWAGIYAKSGSAQKFSVAARNMGLSNSAIQGISARSIGVRAALAVTAPPMPRAITPPSPMPSPPTRMSPSRRLMRSLQRILPDDSGAAKNTSSPEAESRKTAEADALRELNSRDPSE